MSTETKQAERKALKAVKAAKHAVAAAQAVVKSALATQRDAETTYCEACRSTDLARTDLVVMKTYIGFSIKREWGVVTRRTPLSVWVRDIGARGWYAKLDRRFKWTPQPAEIGGDQWVEHITVRYSYRTPKILEYPAPEETA